MGRPSKDIKAEYISIAELSKLVSKSPQSIYKKMKQKPSFNQYVRVFDSKKYVHKSAVWQEFGVVIEGCEPVENKGLENLQPDNPLVNVLTDQVQAQKQQIENMQRTIDSLTEALKAEQILRANADQRIAALLEDKQQAEPPAGDQTGMAPNRGQEQTAGTTDGVTNQSEAGATDGYTDKGQDAEVADEKRQQADSAPLDGDQEPEPETQRQGQPEPEPEQKPMTFLDRIMKALGFR